MTYVTLQLETTRMASEILATYCPVDPERHHDVETLRLPPSNNPARRLHPLLFIAPRYLSMREQALPRTSAHQPVPIYP